MEEETNSSVKVKIPLTEFSRNIIPNDIYYTYFYINSLPAIKADKGDFFLNGKHRIYHINRKNKINFIAFDIDRDNILIVKYDVENDKYIILKKLNILNILEKAEDYIQSYPCYFIDIQFVNEEKIVLIIDFCIDGFYELEINLGTGEKKYKQMKILNCEVLKVQRYDEENLIYLCIDKLTNYILFFKNKKIVISNYSFSICRNEKNNYFLFNNEENNYFIILKDRKYYCILMKKWTLKTHHLFSLKTRNMIFNFICIMYKLNKNKIIPFNKDIVLLIIDQLLNYYKDGDLCLTFL